MELLAPPRTMAAAMGAVNPSAFPIRARQESADAVLIPRRPHLVGVLRRTDPMKIELSLSVEILGWRISVTIRI